MADADRPAVPLCAIDDFTFVIRWAELRQGPSPVAVVGRCSVAPQSESAGFGLEFGLLGAHLMV